MSSAGRSVITIGNFDGVHVGHHALVATSRRLAGLHQERSGEATRVMAMAFDPHPASVLRPGTGPGSEPARLTTFDQRAEMLRTAGADEVVRLEPTAALLAMSPAEFVADLVRRLRPVAFVEGADFRFGHKRAGDVAMLARLGRERAEAEQFAVHVVKPVEVALGDQCVVAASSTMTRWLLERGRVADAARVLGGAYTIRGTVVRGERRGRTLGYPTANISHETMLPADGVYAGRATAFDEAGKRAGVFVAAVSVGTKPQFNAPGAPGAPAARTLEAFLLDAEREAGSAAIAGLPEYGWRVDLEFIAWLRDQARFDGVPALIEQIERDCRRAREAVARFGTLPEPAICAGNVENSGEQGVDASSHACSEPQACHPLGGSISSTGKEAAQCP